MRAVHSLVHGDLLGALDHNLLAVVMFLPAIAFGWFFWIRREWSEPTVASASTGATPEVAVDAERRRKLWLAAFIVIAIFTVIRNIHAVPAFDWLGSSA
jgi:hypothetical protein